MNMQQNQNNKTWLKKSFLLGLLAMLLHMGVIAQSNLNNDGNTHTISYSGHYVDYVVPANSSLENIYFQAAGGDGGDASNLSGIKGGGGALISGYAKIGNGSDEIPAGSTIRFIIGQKGHTTGLYGGGGGGTAISFKAPGGSWTTLLVAGGGGGAGKKESGRSGGIGSAGNGSGGDYSASGHAGGGGGFNASGEEEWKGSGGTKGNDINGQPIGGAGGNCDDCGAPGGFGYGGGGAGTKSPDGLWWNTFTGGGGGGYSGGKANNENKGGSGGSSFSNSSLLFSTQKTQRSKTNTPADGLVSYQFVHKIPGQRIHLVNDQNKCIDLQANKVTNSQNIQLYDCSGSTAQNWAFEGLEVKLAANGAYCLDLKRKETANGTNIQLYECNGGTNQQWVYDGMDRAIRPVMDLSKCVYADKSATDNGTNIQLYDCHYYEGQQWTIDGAATPDLSTTVKTIRPATATTQCLDLYNNNASNGTNIQLWHCNDTEAQNWILDGLEIKLARNEAKCLDLAMSQTTNGTNIRLYSCNGSTNQQWIYDGISQSIRSVLDPDKCLDMVNRWTADGTNVQLYDCKEGETAQQWVIE